MEGYIGEIRMFTGDYAPKGWVFCNGDLLPISKHTDAFSLLGTMYGGDGQTTFKLPDLRGRVPICFGEGTGLPFYDIGETGGTEKNELTAAQVRAHSHAINGNAAILVSTEDNGQTTPFVYPAVNGGNIYSTLTDGHMAPASLSLHTVMSGVPTPEPVKNIQPYLAINYIICLEGVFPSRG